MSARLLTCPTADCDGLLGLNWVTGYALTTASLDSGPAETFDDCCDDAYWRVECTEGHVVLEPEHDGVDEASFEDVDRERLRRVLAEAVSS
jgi:hypothetical protein